jgi:hypothetical protein
LADGCEKGAFVLRLTRPDGTFRTWWMSRPDENALKDPALELVLPEAVEIGEVPIGLLAPQKMPGLWLADEISVKAVDDYFSGSMVVQVDRGGYKEPMRIPKASPVALEKAITTAVESAVLWLLSGPASIWGEPIPAGVLNANAKLCPPPSPITAAEILPENLPEAWKGKTCSGLSIATALSMKAGKNLPWRAIKDVISGALQARFLEIAEQPSPWPCDFPSAQLARFKATMESPKEGKGTGVGAGAMKTLTANAELEPSEVQEMGDVIPDLLKIKTRAKAPLRFQVRIELGDGKTQPSQETAEEINKILKKVKEEFQLR